jgi:hypothetical protein
MGYSGIVMRAIEILNRVALRKGQHVNITWTRLADTLKSAECIVTKTTQAWVRTGIAFRNLETVQDGITQGTRGEVEPLKWGHWRTGFENYIIDHTPKGQVENVEYFRLYPASFPNLQTPKVEWTLNGRAATFAEVEPLLTANEKRHDARECFNVRAENVSCVKLSSRE